MGHLSLFQSWSPSSITLSVSWMSKEWSNDQQETTILKMSYELCLIYCVKCWSITCNFISVVQFLEDSCWGLAFFSVLPINMSLTLCSKSTRAKKEKNPKKINQLSVTFIEDLFSIFKNQSEKIFHSLILAEPLRKQENPSVKFSLRRYYLKTWSVKLGLQ